MKTKVAFVTGCSTGLGFSLAVKLVQQGYIVNATMRSLKNKERLEQACGHSKNLFIILLDLSDEFSIRQAASEVLSRHHKIDVLIHNGAAGLIGPVDSATSSEMEYLFRVNVFAVIQLTQLLLPAMRKQNSGHIILVTSISGVESSAYLGIYAATKFAMEAIGASWATTLNKWNIKVTIIEPGAMNTNLPNTIPIGSYYKSSVEDPYKNFNSNVLSFLKECLREGTDPNQVADQIISILKEPQPQFRYQTCPFSQELVERHLKDPQETSWIEEHRQFVEPFYRKL